MPDTHLPDAKEYWERQKEQQPIEGAYRDLHYDILAKYIVKEIFMNPDRRREFLQFMSYLNFIRKMEKPQNTVETRTNVTNFLRYSEDVRMFNPQHNEALAEFLTARAALIQGVKKDRADWRERMKDYWMNLLTAFDESLVETDEIPHG